MRITQLKAFRLLRRLLVVTLVVACLVPASISLGASESIIVVEDPVLHPAYSTCAQSYWYPFTNDRGHAAYLTLNVNNPSHSSNYAEWHPVIPQPGYYQVEAYIAAHGPITWCTGGGRTIEHDTSDAHYAIHHFYGVTERAVSQYPLSNQWVVLGEFYFTAGSAGYVSLADLNDELEYSTTVSFSAVRFTYTRPTRPQVYLPLLHYTDTIVNPPGEVGIIQADGFDACHLPDVAEMQTWWDASPYTFYGLYLGGVHLPTLCASADASWIRAVHQQGWSFVPIWVGPQAPCTDYKHKMSADPVVSYQQGRQEAESASTTAVAKGLADGATGGTVIYYDMEPYSGANLACRQAVSAFMNGWVERLHEQGNYAGGYGGPCTSYMADWASISHLPDDVWPGYWIRNGYDPNASVFEVPCLSDSLWSNHQRIRQYAGDHSERWGGVQLGIDNDVADGLVAMPPAGGLAIPPVAVQASVDDAGWASADQGWLVQDYRLFVTGDRGTSWDDRSPAPVVLAYALPSGGTWAVSTPDQGGIKLYSSPDWGKTWLRQDIPALPGDWYPLQVHSTTATSGWVVLQKQTSQAFSTAVWLQTEDGELTWHSVDLPAAGKITFTSPTEGWLQDTRLGTVYHTADAGLTWQPGQENTLLDAQVNYPAGTTISGWGSDDLGWAVTSNGSCSGRKSTPSFTCGVETDLWQTLDGGSHWEQVPIPSSTSPKQ